MVLDDMKSLGFQYATYAGFSLGIDDFVIPKEKKPLIEKAQKDVIQEEKMYQEGVISARERFNRVVEIWSAVTDKVSSAMIDEMRKISFEGDEPESPVCHGGFRLAREQAADPSTSRDAGIDE